jgi:hypothetical protein
MTGKQAAFTTLRRGFAREFTSTLVALGLIAAVKVGLITLIPW